MKHKIKEVAPYKILYVDDKTGLAMIEDGVHGQGLSLHPNIDRTGSVEGMKSLGYWKKEDRTVRAFGGIYNIDRYVPEENTELNEVLLQHCKCGGTHGAAVTKHITAEHEAFLKYLEPGSPTLASVLREHWEKGERYYIDSRINIEGHRREFNRLNDMMKGG